MKKLAFAAVCTALAILSCSDNGTKPPPTIYYTLTTSAVNGTISPAGGSFASGTVVTLTVTPNSGHTLLLWGDDLAGCINPVTITMNANKTVSAHCISDTIIFDPQNFQISQSEMSGWSNILDTIDRSVTPAIVDSGWNIIPNFSTFFNAINGGAVDYSVHGWVNGVEQKMAIGWDGPQYQGFVHHFGTADSAMAMFRAMMPDTTVDSIYTIPAFDKSVAYGTYAWGGVNLIGHKNNLYFELSLRGYDESAEAYPTASQFLIAYFNKMK